MRIASGTATSYTIPTDAPEADGTFSWDSTTMIVVELQCGNTAGLGYTYSSKVAAPLCRELIDKIVVGSDPWQNADTFHRLRVAQRNYGREGIAATALSAIDVALWDLKAKLLNQPLVALLGQAHDGAPVYGSGGFTAYDDAQLTAQLGGWAEQGIPRVKMKVGTDSCDDLRRVGVARKAIGDATELFVDANGAYARKQALEFAKRFHEDYGVVWFEEPVSSDDLNGMRLVRDNGPDGLEIAAGEYGFTDMYLRNMLESESIDVLQADATRCGGVTGFMGASVMAQAHPLPLSAHCAPSLHLHLACASSPLRHVEYFHDHVRIESSVFDGFRAPEKGVMYPDLSRPGLGLVFKQQDAEVYRDNI